ncbi:MAG: hypothetical protein K5911_01305 [Eubacteriales bacterium]|nr:hypothetical protein [Eubacteriales bacterium]
MKQAASDRERAEIAISYHAMCLTDVFWVRGKWEKIRYEDICLYDHSLSDAFVDVSLRGKALSAENSELIKSEDWVSDLSTSGVAAKAWIRKDDGFVLLKGGDEFEVQAELLASRIARHFNVEQVLYEPDIYDGVQVSQSKIMTSAENGIVPAEHVTIYAANHDTTLKDIVYRQDRYGYHMMNIIDYLVGNTDRHWGNWGFRVTNRDNRLGKLHPLMDFNRSFRSYDTLDGAGCLTTEESISQKDAAIIGVKAVGLNQISPLPENTEVMFRELNRLSGSRLDMMFEKRLDILRREETKKTDR